MRLSSVTRRDRLGYKCSTRAGCPAFGIIIGKWHRKATAAHWCNVGDPKQQPVAPNANVYSWRRKCSWPWSPVCRPEQRNGQCSTWTDGSSESQFSSRWATQDIKQWAMVVLFLMCIDRYNLYLTQVTDVQHTVCCIFLTFGTKKLYGSSVAHTKSVCFIPHKRPTLKNWVASSATELAPSKFLNWQQFLFTNSSVKKASAIFSNNSLPSYYVLIKPPPSIASPSIFSSSHVKSLKQSTMSKPSNHHFIAP